MTSYPSIPTDVTNAGGNWGGRVGGGGPGPGDQPEPRLDDFNYKLLEEINEGVHAGQPA